MIMEHGWHETEGKTGVFREKLVLQSIY